MLRIFLPLLATLLLASCASVDDSKRTITLDKATRAYEHAIRWGEYEVADSMRRTPEENLSPADPKLLKNIKVTGYAITSNVESNNRSEINRDVQIRYYNLENMKEKTITDKQHWAYDPVAKIWYITTPLPPFR